MVPTNIYEPIFQVIEIKMKFKNVKSGVQKHSFYIDGLLEITYICIKIKLT